MFQAKLLRGDLDGHRFFRHVLLDVGPAAPREKRQHDADDRGDDRPEDLHAVVAVGVGRPAALPVPVTEEKEEEQELDDDEDDAGDPENEPEQAVDPAAVARDPFRQAQPEGQGARDGGENRERKEDEGGAAEPPALPIPGLLQHQRLNVYPLKAKSTVFVSEPVTVTFCVCAPYFSCHASMT